MILKFKATPKKPPKIECDVIAIEFEQKVVALTADKPIFKVRGKRTSRSWFAMIDVDLVQATGEKDDDGNEVFESITGD